MDVTQLKVSRLAPEAELQQKASVWPDRAKGIVVKDQQSYDAGAELVRAIKEMIDEAEKLMRPVIDAAHKSHVAACTALKKIHEPLRSADAIIRAKLSAWMQEQERLAREEAARVAAEIERRRAEEVEAQLMAAEAAGAKPAEIEAMISEVEAEPVVMPAVVPTYRKAAGLSTRTAWQAEVTNKQALIEWVAMNANFNSLLEPSQPNLNALARSMQSNLNIPGVKVVKSTGLSVR